MNNPTDTPSDKTPQRTITRREFVGGALATGVLSPARRRCCGAAISTTS